MIVIKGRKGKYQLALDEHRQPKVAAKTADYRLFMATEVATDKQCLLQVALDSTHNGPLERNAYLLRELKDKSDELEKEYAAIATDPERMLNYHYGFPALLDTFVDADGCRVNVLAFTGADKVGAYWPVSKIVRNNRRIDIRTSAWILGKLLKLLIFAHSQKILVGNLQASNILIQSDEHYVLIFDWSDAKPQSTGVTAQAARQEIAAVARVVIALVGGDPSGRSVPRKGNDNGLEPYTERLFQLAAGSSANAKDAHTEFYALLKTLGWKDFHPFTDFSTK